MPRCWALWSSLLGVATAHATVLRNIPLLPVGGKVHLPTERVPFLAMGNEQVSFLERIQASEHGLFALQAIDSRRVGLHSATEAPIPQPGDIYVLCELLRASPTRGYSHAEAGSVRGVSASALALNRCKVVQLRRDSTASMTAMGAEAHYHSVDVEVFSDSHLEASGGVLEFEQLLQASEAIDAMADSVVHDALIRKAEKTLWTYVLDCKRLVAQLYRVDEDQAPARPTKAQRKSKRRAEALPPPFNSDGTWLREDPFEVISALAPKLRAYDTDSREARAAVRHSRRKALLERSWRLPSSSTHPLLGKEPLVSGASRTELFSFAVAATLSAEELQAHGPLTSRREILYSENTLERLETCVSSLYEARSWLAARSSVESLFSD
eukprot:scaffold5102_cov267-Pinguiococcus_pyrenoidosus.AAC.4